mmetsp:Transcript_6318/g.14426  ORF Transcript_6318/g.14426 Transcript_6318/m.14426 type:complete len:386 (-) Transcript_6318:2474-3631(-)
METVEGMPFSVHCIVIRFAFVVIARRTLQSTAPNARLSSGLETSNVLVRTAIPAAQAALLVLEAVAPCFGVSKACHGFVGELCIGIVLALCDIELVVRMIRGVSDSFSSHKPVIRCAFGFRLRSASPISTPHAWLALDLEAAIGHSGAAVLAAQAVHPVGDCKAAKALRPQTLHLRLHWPRHIRVNLLEGRVALTHWGITIWEGVAASDLRLHITAVRDTGIGSFASEVALRFAVLVAGPVSVSSQCSDLRLAEAAGLTDFVPDWLRGAAIDVNHGSEVGRAAGHVMLHRLSILTGGRVPKRALSAVLAELVRLTEVSLVSARHSATPHARLSLNLEALDLCVRPAIIAGQAGGLVLNGVAALRNSLQASSVAKVSAVDLALGDF